MRQRPSTYTGPNRPSRRSDYIVGRRVFNTRTPLHSFGPYANTRGGLIERTIKKERQWKS